MNVYYVGESSLFNEFTNATVEECYNYLKDKKLVSLDIETTYGHGGIYPREGLDPFVSKIVMFQIGDSSRQYVIDYRITNISMLLPILTDKTVTVVGQNIKFEYLFMLHHEKIRLNNVYDTMVVEQILFNGLQPDASLKGLNKKYLNINVDKGTRLEFLTIGDRPFSKKQIMYGAEDILYPLQIREKQLPDIIKKDLSNCVSLEMLFLEVLGDIEYKGINFDKEIWRRNYEQNHIKYLYLKENLNEWVIEELPYTRFIDRQYDLFAPATKCNINWSSPKQVTDLLEYIDVCPRDKHTGNLTANGKVLQASLTSTNKDASNEYKDFIELYLRYKESERSCSTFGIDFFKYVNPVTDRLHSNYKQILNTGRISSSSPNLQNIPSDDGFRSAFTAPQGWKIVNADYSGQEQIILANKSEDKDLISFYEQNLGDMHSFVASKIFPELVGISLDDIKTHHKDKRQIAKAAGFAINYGGNGYTIANNLGISQHIGDEVYSAYFRAFPGLKNYFNRVQKLARERGYILIDPITGRKYWFKYPRSNKAKGEIDRAALNYPIQGEAGGITKLAPILFRRWILENELQDVVFITNLVHDEINVEVREDYAQLAAKNLEICMKKAADKWCTIVPLNADAVITNHWTH
jgi:DNA polymerase I